MVVSVCFGHLFGKLMKLQGYSKLTNHVIRTLSKFDTKSDANPVFVKMITPHITWERSTVIGALIKFIQQRFQLSLQTDGGIPALTALHLGYKWENWQTLFVWDTLEAKQNPCLNQGWAQTCYKVTHTISSLLQYNTARTHESAIRGAELTHPVFLSELSE